MAQRAQAERYKDTIIVTCPNCKRQQYLDSDYDIINNKVSPDFVCMAHNKNYSVDPVSKTVCMYSREIYLEFI